MAGSPPGERIIFDYLLINKYVNDTVVLNVIREGKVSSRPLGEICERYGNSNMVVMSLQVFDTELKLSNVPPLVAVNEFDKSPRYCRPGLCGPRQQIIIYTSCMDKKVKGTFY